jgi:hypothetical protein
MIRAVGIQSSDVIPVRFTQRLLIILAITWTTGILAPGLLVLMWHDGGREISVVDGGVLALIRTLVLAVVGTSLTMLIGSVLGIWLGLGRSRLAVFAPLLIIPTLVGSTGAAWLWKSILLDDIWTHIAPGKRGVLGFWLPMLLVHCWRELPLVISFVAIEVRRQAASQFIFRRSLGMSRWEWMRLVGIKSICPLLAFLAFFVSASYMSEYLESAIAFRASPGSGTELLSHWIARSYQSASRVDPIAALRLGVFLSSVFWLFSLFAMGFCSFLGLVLARGGVRLAEAMEPPRQSRSLEILEIAGWVVLGSISMAPCGLVFLSSWALLPMSMWAGAALCLVPATFATLGGAAASIALRLRWPQVFAKLRGASVLTIALLVAMATMPHLVVGFAGFVWQIVCSRVLGDGPFVVSLNWIALLVILYFPLTTVICLISQFAVPSNEIALLANARASVTDHARLLFLPRMLPSMIVLGVIVWSLMCGESTVSTMLIGSRSGFSTPATELLLRMEGRVAHFNEAATIVVVQTALALVGAIGLCLLPWVHSKWESS